MYKKEENKEMDSRSEAGIINEKKKEDNKDGSLTSHAHQEDLEDKIDSCRNDDKSEDLKKCESEKEEYLNGWKRAKADFENYKKEETERIQGLVKFSNFSILSDLVIIMDSFDLAVMAEKDNKGLILIRSQLENFLSKNGMISIKALGEKFNPQFHESLGEVKSDGESGIIVEEIERGWMLYDKVLRPTKVKISK